MRRRLPLGLGRAVVDSHREQISASADLLDAAAAAEPARARGLRSAADALRAAAHVLASLRAGRTVTVSVDE